MSNLTGTISELIYANTASGTAKNTFTSEFQINDTAGMGAQAQLPPYFFLPVNGVGKAIRVVARGIVSTTATPTWQFNLRLGAAGSTSAVIGLGSPSITSASGISNKGWEFEGDIIVRTTGAAGANSTLQGAGFVTSPGGFASPFAYELWGGGAQPGTSSTLDISITNYLNFNVICGTSSASNQIQILQLLVFGLN